MDGIIKFDFLTKFAGFNHGISTKKSGNLKSKKNWDFISADDNLNNFTNSLNITSKNLVLMNQVHGNNVIIVSKKDSGKILDGVDGLVTKEQGIFLGVNTADCVPILFIDEINKIIAIAHAGWKGTISEIAKNTVNKMVSLGANNSYIKALLGPSICMHCYCVSDERFRLFKEKFGNDEKLLQKINENNYLDLKAINVKILLDSKLKLENIKNSNICNSCQNDIYFSFRRDKKENYGEMLSVIGIT